MRARPFALVVASALAVAACSASPDTSQTAGGTTRPSAGSTTAQEETPWSYSGENGPQQWGRLAGYETCGTGKRQSPVDITDTSAKNLDDLTFAYEDTTVDAVNTGDTVRFRNGSYSSITFASTQFWLRQIHFHTPSEHTFGGTAYPAELHLVHEGYDKRYAVVSVPLTPGAENEAVKVLTEHLPGAKGETQTSGDTFNPADVLPAQRRTFRYTGSFTTPPCTEGVSWIVMGDPLPVSQGQLDALSALYTGNVRPVQDLGSRQIVEDATSDSGSTSS